MKKIIPVAVLSLLTVAGTALGSGYRIPEQSLNATAKCGANVAFSNGADAAFFNPANMSWLDDRTLLEVNATYIGLQSITYTDNRTSAYNGASIYETVFLPSFFVVSSDYNGFRLGLSLDIPAGLSKEWHQPYPRTFAEEFSLKVIEINPTVSYRINDMVSVAAGISALYAEATVKSAGIISREYGGVRASRDMEGDTWEWGFNLATSVRPVPEMQLAVTYRSNVDLDFEGDGRLATSAAFAGNPVYEGDGGVSSPLPAVLTLAGSYTFFDHLTVELEYDRTFWSEYESLDFSYPRSLGNPFLTAAFDDPKAKNWEDTDTWRFGVSYVLGDVTLMAGLAIDENPVPDATLNFDIPDSDARFYSLGLRYRLNSDMEMGIGYLYNDKESRTVANEVVNGTFDDAGAHLVTVAFSYRL